jgi:hypothetical protein
LMTRWQRRCFRASCKLKDLAFNLHLALRKYLSKVTQRHG